MARQYSPRKFLRQARNEFLKRYIERHIPGVQRGGRIAMCKLFGLRANKPVDLTFSMLSRPRPFQDLASANPDGWGMGWYEGGRAKIFKEPISAGDSRSSFGHMVDRTLSPVFICHVRKGTVGGRTVENCHPFQHEDWLFAHNGSVDRAGLLAQLDQTHQDALKGDTDSEVYFHWILQGIEDSDGDVIEGIRYAISKVKGGTGFNFVLSDGKYLYAYRDACNNGTCYTLWYLERDPASKSLLKMRRSPETDVLFESKALSSEKAVLVCSEKLTEEAWQETDLGQMLVVSDDLTCRIERMR